MGTGGMGTGGMGTGEPSGEQADAEVHVTVHLLGVPIRLWERATAHNEELLREFMLVHIGATTGTATKHVPAALLRMMADLRQRYAGITSAQSEQLEAALRVGEQRRDFTYDVPRGVGAACTSLQLLMDEADDYCRNGTDLMTLVSPEDQRQFRRWFLQEFVRQEAGEAPKPWTGPL